MILSSLTPAALAISTDLANAWGIMKGASILRVHDVKETVRLARMLDAIRNSEG